MRQVIKERKKEKWWWKEKDQTSKVSRKVCIKNANKEEKMSKEGTLLSFILYISSLSFFVSKKYF